MFKHPPRKLSEATRKKMSEARKGLIPWNKGKKDSEEHKKNVSIGLKNQSKESRRKMLLKRSESLKGNKNSLGYKHTTETKQKMSEAGKGRKLPPFSEEHRKNMSEARKGMKLSEEHRKKISKAGKGRKASEATRKKLSEARKGIKFSNEHKKKLSIERKKRITTEETKQKMSKTMSSPKYAEIARQNLRTARHNQVKPNKRESQIGQILTEAEIRFKFHRNVDYQTIENKHRKKEVDIFIKPKKIIEHNGTYNHADPRKYKPDDLIREHNKMVKASEIWKREKIILNQIKKQGYKILVIWEQDLLQDTENTTKKILRFARK
jgi:nitrate reductase alpha subunit